MGTRVLIDSSLLIDLINGVTLARIEFQAHRDRAISIVSWIEVMAGVRPGEEDRTRLFLDSLHVIPLTAAIAAEAAEIRRSSRLKLPDAVILASAHMEKRVLLTRNTRDFAPGRFVRIPYEL